MIVRCNKGNNFLILFSEFCVLSAFVLFWDEYKTSVNSKMVYLLSIIFLLLQVFLIRWFLSISRTIVFTDENIEVVIFGKRLYFSLAETTCFEYRRVHLRSQYEKSYVFCPNGIRFFGRLPPLMSSIIFHPICLVFVNCKEYSISSFPPVFETPENDITEYLSIHGINTVCRCNTIPRKRSAAKKRPDTDRNRRLSGVTGSKK